MANSSSVNLWLMVAIIVIGIMFAQWLIMILYCALLLSFIYIPFSFMCRANKAINKYNNE